MEVRCTTCREPWDTNHLRDEAIHDTSLPTEEILGWQNLPTAQRLTWKFREEFMDAGWHFGSSLMNVIKCPACPAGVYPDKEKLELKAEIEANLSGDEEALAAQYNVLDL